MNDENDDLSPAERHALRIFLNSDGEFLPLKLLPSTSARIIQSLLERRLIEAGPPVARYSKYRIGYRLTTAGKLKADRIHRSLPR
jgi:hypothetical protein